MAIVEEKVRPEREKTLAQSRSKDKEKRASAWWKFARTAQDLYTAIAGLERVLVISQVGNAFGFVFLPKGIVYSHRLIVFPFSSNSSFAILQSRIHELWARFLSYTLKDDFAYGPSDCFETFPFPGDWETDPTLEEAGKAYYEFRADLMARNNEGLTKTYNRFHDPNERDPDIVKLRELHAAMDRAVLDAYGWTDIPTDCDFLLDYEDEEEEDENGGRARRRKKPWRCRWPDPVRDEVLARLLELNAQRAAAEQRSGAAAQSHRRNAPRTRRTRRAGDTGGDGSDGDGALFL